MTHPKPTTSALQEILDTSLDTSSLQAHIDAADYEVDEIQDKDSSISDGRLTEIHKWLAAHYATSQDPRADSTSRETASISYADDNADYKSIAIRLDPTGTIASGSKPKASLSVPDSKGIND